MPLIRAARRWRRPARAADIAVAAAGAAAPSASGVAESLPVRSGTAFFVSPAGDMLTSAHVVAGCSGVPVWPPEGRQTYARVVARSAESDVALLSASGKPPAFIATAMPGALREGTPLTTVGFGVLRHWPRLPVLSHGPMLGYAKTPAGNQVLVIGTELPGGNSGGPVIDDRGALVGMVIGRLASSPARGVAVPTRDLARFLAEHGVMPQPQAPPRETEENAASALYGISALVQCAASG